MERNRRSCNLNAWEFFAFVYDGTDMSIYANGK